MSYRLKLEDECAPFNSAEDGYFLSKSGIYSWYGVAGLTGGHAILMKSPNSFTFGVGDVAQIISYKSAMENRFLQSMGIVAAIKELAEYVHDEEKEFVKNVDVNDVNSWIPLSGKFASVHHFGAVNLVLGLYLQRKARKTHKIECAVCSITGKKQKIVSANALLVHARTVHVHTPIPEHIVQLCSCKKAQLEQTIHGTTFLNVMDNVMKKVTEQVVINFPLE